MIPTVPILGGVLVADLERDLGSDEDRGWDAAASPC